MPEYQIELETRAGRWDITDHVLALRLVQRQRWGVHLPTGPDVWERYLVEEETDLELDCLPLHHLPPGTLDDRALLHLTAPDAPTIHAEVTTRRERMEVARNEPNAARAHSWHVGTELRAQSGPLGRPVPILYAP
jgi:hypothetical protein